MDFDTAIRVEQVTKSYRLYNSPADRVKEAFHPLRKKYHHGFHALRDVSIEVKKGECVGIVGRNGSGKSTLLQIIAGVVSPTSGSVRVCGRISAILELGSGFNPEFTGRQNVYLNAAILGLKEAEVDHRMDDILRFADIGEFIDQPVKTYSSGMMMRLAFAVQASVDPEIMIVDEALSVGDEAFQRKCFARIELLKKRGTTILFVSHSGSAVVELCTRAILLDRGDLLLTGKPKFVVSSYQKLLYAPGDKVESLRTELKEHGAGRQDGTAPESLMSRPDHIAVGSAEEIAHRPKAHFDPHMKSKSLIRYESRGATIEEPCLTTLDGKPVNHLARREEYIYTYTVCFDRFIQSVRFGMLIKTLSGLELGGAITASSLQQAVEFVEAGQVVRASFRFRCMLVPGAYFMNAGVQGISNGIDGYVDRIIDAMMFKVQPEPKVLATAIVDFDITPSVKLETLSPAHAIGRM